MAEALSASTLLAVDAVIYAVLVAGLWEARRVPLPKADSAKEAFRILEGSLERAFPDMPAGFTLREAVEKTKKLKLKVDWHRVESELTSYEACRYGGWEQPQTEKYEVVKLAAVLRRRGRIGI